MEIAINILFIFLSIYITEFIHRILKIKRQSNIYNTIKLGICWIYVMSGIWFQAKFLNIGQAWMRFPMNQPEYILETGTMYLVGFLILYSLAICVTIVSKRIKKK